MFPVLFLLLVRSAFYDFYVNGQCVMVDRADFKGKDSTSLPQIGVTASNLEDCKTNCLSINECVATEFRNVFCVNWNADPQSTANPGSTISVKQCNTVVTCSMSQVVDTDASNAAFEESINNKENCRDACQKLSQCHHAVYVTSSNTCHLYNTSGSTTSQAGYASFQKKNCDSGEFCCFDEFADQSRSDTPTLTYTASLAACEELCLATDSCNASVFTGTSCRIFTQPPITASSNGRTLSTKTCPAGASTGSFTYIDTCNKGLKLIPSFEFVLFLFAALIFNTGNS